MEYLMSPVIARREFVRTPASGSASIVEASIGIPLRIRPEQIDSDWYCTIQVLGLGEDGVRAAFGVDPFQALELALKMIDVIISTSPKASELDGFQEDE